MKLGSRKLRDDKVMTKRQVAALLYGAIQMKRDPERPSPWAFDALLLMYLLALRADEVTMLRYSHVGKRDTSGVIRSVHVPTLKKSRMEAGRRVRIPPLEALHEVPVLGHHDWLARVFDNRTRVGKAALSEWLFPSRKKPGDHLSSRMLDYAFREARDRAGLSPVYSTHVLRHTAATEVARTIARRGAGDAETLAWVAKFLRHSGTFAMKGSGEKVTGTYIHLAPRSMSEWAPLIDVLTLPTPLAPLGPSRFKK